MSGKKKCWDHTISPDAKAEQERHNTVLALRRILNDVSFAKLEITCGEFLSFLKVMDECHAHGEATTEDIKSIEGLVEKMLKRHYPPLPKPKKSRSKKKKKPKESV